MYSYRRLPASLNKNDGLSGVLDIFGMRSYWNALKGKINELRALPARITQHWARISNVQRILLARGDKNANLMGDELKKIADDMQKASKVNQYIDTYLPEWMKLDQGATTAPIGVGFVQVPFVLAGMALVALSYCVNTGLALLQDYAYKSQLTEALIEKKITSGQMAEVLSVPREETIVDKVISNVGLGVGIGIPTVLLVGGGLYLAFQTGMLKGVINSVSSLLGGSSSSSQSSS